MLHPPKANEQPISEHPSACLRADKDRSDDKFPGTRRWDLETFKMIDEWKLMGRNERPKNHPVLCGPWDP